MKSSSFYFFSLLLILGLILTSGCVDSKEQTKTNISEENKEQITENDKLLQTQETEHMGGKYNLTLNITKITYNNKTFEMKKIQYVKDGQVVDPDQILPDNIRPSLDWLNVNTPEDAIIMAWWDYGHVIRAYAQREPVVDSPSKEILITTVAKHMGKSTEDIDCPGCVPHTVIVDIAEFLLSFDPDEATEIMKKYNATYLYVHIDDESKSGAFYIALDRQPEQLSPTIVGKAIEQQQQIDGFELVYADNIARIYKLKE